MHAAKAVETQGPIARASERHWQQAFRELRRDDWPNTLAELGPQTLQFRFVRLRATLIARGIVVEPSSSPNSVELRAASFADSAVQTVAIGPPTSVASAEGGLDRKRLAAGERAEE